MTKYLSIATGETPASAEAVFVSDDPELIELVLACVLRRLDMLRPEVRRTTPSYATVH